MGRARKESEQQLAASVREVTDSMSDTVSKAAVKAVTKATQNFEKTAGERATASSSVYSADSEVLWHRRLHSKMLEQQFSEHHHVTDRLMDLLQNKQSTVSASSVAMIPEKKEVSEGKYSLPFLVRSAGAKALFGLLLFSESCPDCRSGPWRVSR